MRFIMPRFFVNCERWTWNADLRLYVSTQGHFKDEHKRNQACKVKNNYFWIYANDKWIPAHRAVLLTWRPLPADGEPMTVDHLNSITRDNRLCNLEWVTEAENLRRAEKNVLKTEVADCKVCQNFKPATSEKLGPFVRWKELCEKLGYAKSATPYKEEGFMDKVKELWESGQVVVYKNKSATKITPAMVQQAIAGQPNPELITERFLIKSITRTGKYLGWMPWMRWSK